MQSMILSVLICIITVLGNINVDDLKLPDVCAEPRQESCRISLDECEGDGDYREYHQCHEDGTLYSTAYIGVTQCDGLAGPIESYVEYQPYHPCCIEKPIDKWKECAEDCDQKYPYCPQCQAHGESNKFWECKEECDELYCSPY